ncbi:endonuclease/exonuclease/phosphatase family protein [Agrococcus carbonis]|uniref:Metal-dependent hydrolase, endonuclease/exonuclease/phosphatase family n=1 Tax=Agrococcus carbonis TaxID=684552 RepID=A0A1H1P0A2_9MICO|nr:endonuclease/exonuclease/phosphatase family protein [Agrococcus carbonis]SDS04623.1 Metal-dependent hydrolase, endonuclease/exonuclease/phosphatase family [Agrococcus carbonis]
MLGPVAAPALHVATWNVRRRMRAPLRPADRWRSRLPLLQVALRRERPTLLAVQEAMPDQAEAVGAALGARYRRVGVGRGRDGRGEGCPIFFDSDRLELVGWSQRALSDRPDDPGSMSWGNRIPRAAVEATLRDRETGVRFLAISTHFDVFSSASRVRSAHAVRDRVALHGLPALVLGDLNARPGSPMARALLAGGVLTDAWERAAVRVTPEWGTYAGYRRPRSDGRRIDWIATTPDVEVLRIGIDGDARASDHLPVHAAVRLPEPVDASAAAAGAES